MAKVTIPKELIERKDLVAVRRETFAEFVAWEQKLKTAKTFTPTTDEEKALAQARASITTSALSR